MRILFWLYFLIRFPKWKWSNNSRFVRVKGDLGAEYKTWLQHGRPNLTILVGSRNMGPSVSKTSGYDRTWDEVLYEDKFD